ncbi:MAG: response regulator [Proteobacteria bacterium]|nr:response regulator [Pseudomonadota bacterium]MBU1686179.1 response regulator [Pseudomonadota bacterium]
MAFNILLVDDSETMRAVIRRVVEMSGVPVDEFHEAGNGFEALDVLKDNWIDVILSDINMPEMGGMELLVEVKRNEVTGSIPVIFITTEASDAKMAEAKRLGVSGYIKKPFVPEGIKAVLLEVLEKAYDHKPISDAEIAEASDDDMDF